MNDDIYNSKVMIEVKPDDYYNDFRNTNNLPLTSIYNLIEDDYPAFLSDPDNKNILLTSVFDFNYKGFLITKFIKLSISLSDLFSSYVFIAIKKFYF